jgi:glycosyltransferase involved in cell wall biosynthesis
MKAAILTDFVSHDDAYSLCNVVANQVKMLTRNGHECKVLVRKGFPEEQQYEGAETVVLDHGETGSNEVKVTDRSASEIDALERQLGEALLDCSVVLTHDLIYQANLWKANVAARRVGKNIPSLRWLHWVHSSTNLKTAEKAGRFRKELEEPFPNSKLVAMHVEEVMRKGHLYGYERNQIVLVPNPLDVMAHYHPVAKYVLAGDWWKADAIAVFPARLDRGKQPHIILEVFSELRQLGWDARVVIVDFHSTGGDKASYRNEMIQQHGDFVTFTSTLEGNEYHIPHRAVMDLFDYADVFIHPSRSECDPLTVPEAAWKRNLLVLNYDLPVFRLWDGGALHYKWSSNIDVNTGLPGETNTAYGNWRRYCADTAAAIAHMLQNDMPLANHRRVRQERSLEAVAARHFLPVVLGGSA